MSKICNKCGWSNKKEIYCANCGNILNDKNIDINNNDNINLNTTSDSINIDILGIIKWIGLLILFIIISLICIFKFDLLYLLFDLNSSFIAILLIVGITILITLRIKHPKNKLFAKITKYLITFIIAQITIGIFIFISCYMTCNDPSFYDSINLEGCD